MKKVTPEPSQLNRISIRIVYELRFKPQQPYTDGFRPKRTKNEINQFPRWKRHTIYSHHFRRTIRNGVAQQNPVLVTLVWDVSPLEVQMAQPQPFPVQRLLVQFVHIMLVDKLQPFVQHLIVFGKALRPREKERWYFIRGGRFCYGSGELTWTARFAARANHFDFGAFCCTFRWRKRSCPWRFRDGFALNSTIFTEIFTELLKWRLPTNLPLENDSCMVPEPARGSA